MGGWANIAEETKHDEVRQLRSYFGTEPERDVESNGGESVASATAREISVRRRAPVTAKILFDAALAHGPAILCVIPEAQVSAATNEELHQAILDFVTAGGCYAVMVPAGKPPWPASGDDRVHNLVKVWRDIYDSAGTVVKKLRQALKSHDDSGDDGAGSRVQLVTPKMSDQDGHSHLSLVRLLPPTLGPAMRPWLLFAGAGPMEDDLAYTCGVVESVGDKLWTRLSVVAPFMRQRMGADGTRTPDREDLRALRNYCFDVLRTWARNGRQQLGSECISDLWAYADISADEES
jgi:hypothetical protein